MNVAMFLGLMLGERIRTRSELRTWRPSHRRGFGSEEEAVQVEVARREEGEVDVLRVFLLRWMVATSRHRTQKPWEVRSEVRFCSGAFAKFK